MRSLTLLVLLLGTHAIAQLYPYAGVYVKGAVTLKDSSQEVGEVMWVAHQNQQLRFRTTEQAEPLKYGPEEILGFTADTFTFVPLLDIQVWAENTALLGKRSRIKHVFAQRLHAGTFNVYMVFIEAYDGVSGAIQTYPNLLFQNTAQPGGAPVPCPYGIRMKDARFEKTKEPLYALFKDHPTVVEQLRAYQKEGDPDAIIAAVKAIDTP